MEKFENKQPTTKNTTEQVSEGEEKESIEKEKPELTVITLKEMGLDDNTPLRWVISKAQEMGLSLLDAEGQLIDDSQLHFSQKTEKIVDDLNNDADLEDGYYHFGMKPYSDRSGESHINGVVIRDGKIDRIHSTTVTAGGNFVSEDKFIFSDSKMGNQLDKEEDFPFENANQYFESIGLDLEIGPVVENYKSSYGSANESLEDLNRSLKKGEKPWRLPTLEEGKKIVSLVAEGKIPPIKLDKILIRSGQSMSYFWTSEESIGGFVKCCGIISGKTYGFEGGNWGGQSTGASMLLVREKQPKKSKKTTKSRHKKY